MKPRLPLIFVAAISVIGLIVAGVAIAASGVGGSAVAYRVNDAEVSQSTVDQDLKSLADKDSASEVKQVFGIDPSTTEGAVNSSFTASWLSLQIRNELFRQVAAKAKATVGEKERDAQRSVVNGLLKQGGLKFRLAALPKPMQDTLLAGFAYPAALKLDTDAQVTQFLGRALRQATVRVDPRYGRWTVRQGVCPPTGCAPTSAGG
jgi:hypothetical protein